MKKRGQSPFFGNGESSQARLEASVHLAGGYAAVLGPRGPLFSLHRALRYLPLLRGSVPARRTHSGGASLVTAVDALLLSRTYRRGVAGPSGRAAGRGRQG